MNRCNDRHAEQAKVVDRLGPKGTGAGGGFNGATSWPGRSSVDSRHLTPHTLQKRNVGTPYLRLLQQEPDLLSLEGVTPSQGRSGLRGPIFPPSVPGPSQGRTGRPRPIFPPSVKASSSQSRSGSAARSSRLPGLDLAAGPGSFRPPLERQASRKASPWRCGPGGRKKRRPSCNGADTASRFGRHESELTSDWSFLARESADPLRWGEGER